MKAEVTSMTFKNGTFNINGKVDFPLEDNSMLCIRKREVEHGLEYPEEFHFPVSVNNNEFNFESNLNDLFQGISLNHETVWDLFLFIQDEYKKLEVPNSIAFSSVEYQILKNKLFKAKPYITGERGVSIFVLQNSIESEVEDALFNNGVLQLSVRVSNNAIVSDDEWEGYSVRLKIKKREQEKLFEYYESKTIEPLSGINSVDFSIDLEKFFENYTLKKNLVWDLFIELVQKEEGLSVEVPLMNANGAKHLIDFNYHNFVNNDLFRVKPYVTGKGNIAIFVRSNEVNAKFSQFTFENNFIEVSGSISSREYEVLNLNELDSYIVFKKRTIIGKQFEYLTEKVENLPILNNYFNEKLDISDFFKDEVIRHGDIWDVFIRVTTLDGRKMDVMVSPGKEIQRVNYNYELLEIDPLFKFKPYVNGQGTFSIYFIDSNKNQKDAVKIAVLGSCFSRNPFNSTGYFNPGYKKNYSVVLTQFHSSIISIMASPLNVEVDKLSDVSNYNKQFIVNDFEKNFFKQLKETNPDYLIIDLYADACRDIMKIDEETYVSASLALRQSKYFKEFVEYEVITHANNDQYFALWKEYMSRFAERIKEFFPEERIILNVGGFTYKYHDEDGTIKKFPREHIIQRNNYFWDKINSWFLQCIPGCKVINLKDTPYIGQHDHPFGKTFSHYQSGYYKEFMNRLNKLVLQDLQKDKMKEKSR